ncbi:MAG: hypothetical protein JW763_06445 [candidate division Zixibacteria bacterium]|nr:hypothetical protein [candidate division Zixibacteria bacterium]
MKIKTAILLIILAVMMCGCVERLERPKKIIPSDYFPLHEGDRYLFSSSKGEAVVTRQLDNLFTKTYYDSAGHPLSHEDYILDEHGGVYWNNMYFGSARLASVHFVPSLPFAPWSNIVGDTLLVSAVEIRSDSTNTHVRVQVAYEIMAIESVVTPAGLFEDCVKVRMSYSALGGAASRVIAPEIIRWFARDVGVVKFETSLIKGELLEATVDGVSYPQNP